MMKKTLMAAAVASAIVSTSANAAITLNDPAEINFASELFGTSDILLGATGVNLAYVTDAAIAPNASATFTFTLDNGTFGADPALTVAGGTAAATITLTAGGQGSSTATFTVANSAAFASTDTLTLNVPSISGADLSGNGSKANVTLAISGANIVTDAYPTSLTQADTVVATGAPAISTNSMAVSILGIEVAEQVSFVTATASSTTDTVIVLDDSVNISADATAFGSDGQTAFALVSDDTVTYSLNGALSANAEICIVPTGETNCDNAIGDSDVTTSGASIELTPIEAISTLNGTQDLLYIVDGKSSIPLTDLSVSVSVAFDSATLGSVNASSNSAGLNSIGLYGLDNSAKVNTITNPGSGDATYVRATNSNSSEAIVYVQLTAQDGSDLGFGAMTSVGAGETVVYTSDDFATASGSETWSGRARATISSDQDLTLVPLIRTNDVLTNQSGSVDVD